MVTSFLLPVHYQMLFAKSTVLVKPSRTQQAHCENKNRKRRGGLTSVDDEVVTNELANM